MALEKKRIKEVPADAIILTEDQALKYHYKVLSTWKNQYDILGYKYGSYLLGAAALLSGVFINNHFRRKLKLFSYGQISSYLPVCVVPATMTFVSHHETVLRNLVLLNHKDCPVCIELRASAMQSFFGLILPLFLAPVSSIGFAIKYGTYNVPPITQEPLQVVKLTYKLAKPIKNVLFGIFIGQALLASAITYWEAQSIYTVHHKLNDMYEHLTSSRKQ